MLPRAVTRVGLLATFDSPISRHSKSVLMASVQFFHGLPLPFLHTRTQSNGWISLSKQNTWPSHFYLLFLIIFSISSCPTLGPIKILLFVMLLRHVRVNVDKGKLNIFICWNK